MLVRNTLGSFFLCVSIALGYLTYMQPPEIFSALEQVVAMAICFFSLVLALKLAA